MSYELIVNDWEQYIIVFFLVLCRITPPLVFNSINPLSMLPPYIKVIVTVIFGVIISSNVIDENLISRAVQLDGMAMAVAYLNEFFIGLTFWLALVVTYGAILTFLKLLDMQVGLTRWVYLTLLHESLNPS